MQTSTNPTPRNTSVSSPALQHTTGDAASALRATAYPSAEWNLAPLGNLSMWRSAALAGLTRLTHVFTPGGYDLALRVPSDPAAATDQSAREAVLARRRAVCQALGVPFGRLAHGRQVHGTNVAVVDDPPSGRCDPDPIDGRDGFVTHTPGIPLMTLTADCPLLLLYDERRHALGLAHAGWRGAVAGMPAAVVEALRREYASRPEDLTVVVSPSAGGCCYEVREDVVGQVIAASAAPEAHLEQRSGRTYLNLPTLIAERLTRAGVPRERIHLPGRCTICDRRFNSYRREGRGVSQSALLACLQ